MEVQFLQLLGVEVLLELLRQRWNAHENTCIMLQGNDDYQSDFKMHKRGWS